MSEFVKKTALGYRAVSGGHSDAECSHVILTKEEYNKLLQEKSQAEQEKRNAAHESEKTVKRAQDTALTQIHKAEEKSRQSVADIEHELATEKNESDYQRRLNANLLRISKERANADRKLKPKKEHTGYIVVSSAEKEYRYQDGSRHWKTVTLWETVLQSPYSVDFTEEQARKQIPESLFQKDENHNCPIQKIGITANYGHSYTQMIADKEWRKSCQQYNIMLNRHLRANFRAGYWELVFLHTKPLGLIPKDMRAR